MANMYLPQQNSAYKELNLLGLRMECYKITMSMSMAGDAWLLTYELWIFLSFLSMSPNNLQYLCVINWYEIQVHIDVFERIQACEGLKLFSIVSYSSSIMTQAWRLTPSPPGLCSWHKFNQRTAVKCVIIEPGQRVQPCGSNGTLSLVWGGFD